MEKVAPAQAPAGARAEHAAAVAPMVSTPAWLRLMLRARVPRRAQAWVTLAVFAAVLGVRLVLIGLFGEALPYSDQWDSEGWNWLRPWQLGGAFDWEMLFSAHNEHRIAIARLAALALFDLNDAQWDNLVFATANAFVVATGVALTARALQRQDFAGNALVTVLLAATACMPTGFENLLIGFQLQVFSLILLAVAGAGIVATMAAGWRLAVACACICAASLFTMASGLFTAAAMFAGLSLRCRGADWRWLAPALVVCAAAFAFGIHLLAPVADHVVLHAANAREFLLALARLGAWPLPDFVPLSALAWLPSAALAWRLLRRRDADPIDLSIVVLAGWAALQIVAIAYGRGHDLTAIASRYTDVLAVGVLANACCLLRLVACSMGPRWLPAAAALWLFALAAAFGARATVASAAMLDFATARAMQAQNVRGYVRGINPDALKSAEPWNLPYPDRSRLRMMLDDHVIRYMLPPSVRQQVAAYTLVDGFEPRPAAVAARSRMQSWGVLLRSRTLEVGPAHRPFLRFAAAGDFGDAGISVRIDDGTTQRDVRFASHPHGVTTLDVPAPRGAFAIRLADADPRGRFAVAAPVETGRLSHAAAWLLAHAAWLFGGAGLLLAVAVARIARAGPRSDEAAALRDAGAGRR